MRAVIAVVLLTLLLAAAIPRAEEEGSYLAVKNNAPYPVIAEVLHRFEGTVAEVPVLPGEEVRITLSPGNYMLSVRPAVPFYFVELYLTPDVLLQNPYVILPIELGPAEEYTYTYTPGNLTQARAGLVVIRSVLNITALMVDNHINVRAGSFPAGDRNYYGAVFMIGEGNHTFFAALNEEEPILCLMKYRVELSIRPGDELVVDIPQNLSKYVRSINVTNELGEPVLVGIYALSSGVVTESYAPVERVTAYTLSRELVVSARSSVVINACVGRYWVKAWGINSPKEISLKTLLNLTDSSEGVAITVPGSLGGGALTIKAGECVTAIDISGEGISLSLRGREDTTLLLPQGEYLVSAKLGRCGIVNTPNPFVTKVSLGSGDSVTIEVPPPPVRLTIRNSVDYEIVVSIVSPAGGLIHTLTIPPSSQSVLEILPGNYTITANPLMRPEYYVGPLSGLRWETNVSLEQGDNAVLEAEPSTGSVLEVEGPPGAEVLVDWGTSSAKYVIPPEGILLLSAAPVTYNISSCPADVFHDCWSTTINASGGARVVVEYGLRLDTVAGTALVTAAATAAGFMVVRRGRWSKRTRPEGTEAPP